MLISAHLPKTAGSSFMSATEVHYCEQLVRVLALREKRLIGGVE